MGLEVLTENDLESFRIKLLGDIESLLNLKRPKKWLKTNEVMEMLGMSEVTLQTLRNRRQIPFKKLGGICYYNAEELDVFLENL